MRQIVITEKMLDQLVGEAQDRVYPHLQDACDHTPEGKRFAVDIAQRVRNIIKRLGEDIKDSTL